MEQEQIWNLVAKKLSGEASDEELRELETMLRSNPELHYPMQTITDLWHSNQSINRNIEEAHKAFDKHIERMQSLNVNFTNKNIEPTVIDVPKKSKRKIILICTAVVSATFLFISFRIFNSSQDSSPTLQKSKSEISTRYGSKTNLVLPDGTKVWLNAGSKLNYDKNYGNNIREVGLTGEAYFDVVKNAEKPFIIHTGKIEIKVLGTAFNVKSYPGEKTIETSLIRGSIEITFKDRPSEKVILKPNEKLVVANEDVQVVSTKRASVKEVNEPIVAISHLNYARRDSTIIETAWVQNKLFFQDESFKELAAQMQRWFGVNIRFDNSERDTLHFTGSFENETIQQALDALKLTARFNYDIQGNQIDILK
jgi:ferric-dicitrate binding protein FerR (iron transport regulator)